MGRQGYRRHTRRACVGASVLLRATGTRCMRQHASFLLYKPKAQAFRSEPKPNPKWVRHLVKVGEGTTPTKFPIFYEIRSQEI